jgi:hypothetical protein
MPRKALSSGNVRFERGPEGPSAYPPRPILTCREEAVMQSRIINILKESGIVGLGQRGLKYVYHRNVRPLLPSTEPILYAGIPIGRDRKLGDRALPSFLRTNSLSDEPDYEIGLVSAIRNHVKIGDKVVVVGGGEGVTATIAAQEVGIEGSVICFEGSAEGVRSVYRTAERNGVSSRLSVRHNVVGQAISVYGSNIDSSNKLLEPRDLPLCDFLELDCEGAERIILRDMQIRPRAIAVETHGVYGATTPSVRSQLEMRGYVVVDTGWAEPRLADECEKNDIRVLIGTT